MARVSTVTTNTNISSAAFGNSLITDYLSQTDTATQNIASDVNMAAGKRLKADYLHLNPAAPPTNVAGHMYYDTALARYMIYDATYSFWGKVCFTKTASQGWTATITAGNNYVDTTHNWGSTPPTGSIKIEPTSNLAGRSHWLSDIGATTFRININSMDGMDHTFQCKIMV